MVNKICERYLSTAFALNIIQKGVHSVCNYILYHKIVNESVFKYILYLIFIYFVASLP